MVNANADALGIIFPNSYDEQVPDLVNERLMASIPFASRYRMVDFILSSMVNCGIGNVSIIVRKNYHSLMDHLGSGREWDLARKKGGLNIVPPYSGRRQKLLRENQLSALHFLHGRTEDQQDLCKLGGKRSTECIDEYLRDGASASDRRNQKRLCPWK